MIWPSVLIFGENFSKNKKEKGIKDKDKTQKCHTQPKAY